MQPGSDFEVQISIVKPTPEPEEQVPMTSSVPDDLPAEQEALYREVLSIFEQQELPFAVAGAAALQQYTGICRYAKDLDIFLSAHDAPAALLLLQRHGFETEVRDPVWLAKARRNGYFVDLITGMSNGVLSVDSTWIERARPANVIGVKTRVLAPEELLASKLFVVRRERFDGDRHRPHYLFIAWTTALEPGAATGRRALGSAVVGVGFVSLCLSRPDRLCPSVAMVGAAGPFRSRSQLARPTGKLPRQSDR